jgi:lipopolysaccharide/colanic/teichoic acid biosynthesis glycosyltransferase
LRERRKAEMDTSSTHPLANITLPSSNRPQTLKDRVNNVLRRGLDILAALLGLFFLSPLFLLIGLAIKRDSPGPAYFHGLRAGKHGKPFKIHKFRTMYHHPQRFNGPKVTANGDERITPLGKWLRTTKVNELPQLWNVLVGDMSLVGPRPEDVDIAAEWPEAVRKELFSVRPGVTSPATVIYRDEENQLDASTLMQDYLYRVLPPKLRLELLYVRSRNMLTDIDVIFWTAVALLPSLRKVKIPENTLLFGPLSRAYSRYLSWFSADTFVAFIAMALSGVLWRIESPLNLGVGRAISITLATSLTFSVTNYIFGLHRVEWSRAPWPYVFPLGLSCALAVSSLVAINLLFLDHFLPDRMLVMAGIFAFMGFTAFRYRERLLTGAASRWISLRGGVHTIGERVLAVGAGDNFSLATWLLNRSEWATAYSIVGIVDDDPRKAGRVIEGHRVLGVTAQIPELVKKLDIGLILFTIDNISPIDHQRILELCQQTKVQIVMLPESLDHFRGQMRNGFNPDNTVENGEGHHDAVSFTPAQVQTWIEDLDNLADQGDLKTLRERLDQIKKAVSN